MSVTIIIVVISLSTERLVQFADFCFIRETKDRALVERPISVRFVNNNKPNVIPLPRDAYALARYMLWRGVCQSVCHLVTLMYCVEELIIKQLALADTKHGIYL